MNDGSWRTGSQVRERRTATLSFEAVDADPGLAVRDPIERHRYALGTSAPVAPEPVDADRFEVPVDRAVRISTAELTLPSVELVYVRDESGAVLAEAEHFAYEELPAGSYTVELCAPIKLYLQVESAVTVSADLERTRIGFTDESDVVVGARSHHTQPAATVTTTNDPADLMAAVSTFGSALKTLTPERSYPTLRGHPPTVELGDELDVPDSVAPPESGVRIELPPEYDHIFVAAPLAYYLGATLVPGDVPRIVTDTGFAYDLDAPDGFEAEVERVLKRTFFLDCLTRTEGHYPVELNERRRVEETLALDFADLYDRSLAEQVERYLRVPHAAVEAHIPEWKLATHVAPSPDSVELLPFLVDDLAVVRTPRSRTVSADDAQVAAVDEFMRDDGFTRSTASGTEVDGSFVQPEATGAMEEAWVGDGTPLGASKATVEAFRNRLDRAPADGDIDITVVCNDAEMDEERGVVDDVYGSREELPFDVAVRRNLTTSELRATLERETEFLHYIGHIDAAGFECADGKLDATTLEAVGVDAFLLNACQSYDQGMALIDAGSIGGVVTLDDVINSGAVEIGCTMARLLNCGFPLWAALDVARGESVVGGQYTVVGDGGIAIAQSGTGTPNLCEVTSDGDVVSVEITTYPTSDRGLGSMIMPYLRDNDEYFLSSGTLEAFEMTWDELEQFLSGNEVPVRIDGELRWSGEMDTVRDR